MENKPHIAKLMGSESRPYWQCSCGEIWSAGREQKHPPTIERVEVILFKTSGKYYTTEFWRIPTLVTDTRPNGTIFSRPVIGPYDMIQSPDFRRIDGGPVLITSQEPWSYPILFPSEPVL